MSRASRHREEPRATTLEQLLAAKEIVVFCGSGGVGKTSVAAAARTWFERAIRSGGWPAFGFIAAETDLRRLP